MRYQSLDRQLDTSDNATNDSRNFLDFPLSAISNNIYNVLEFSNQEKTCFKQYIDHADNAASACCKMEQ